MPTRHFRTSRRLATGTVVFVLAGCTAEEPRSLAWCEAAGGEPVSLSAGASRWQREGVSLRFTEVWRRGGARPGEELSFPFAIAVSSVHGRLALADFELAEAVVVSANGDWEGPWTRSGSGPGEVRAPLGVAWDSAGSLLIYDIGRHTLIRMAGPVSITSESPVPPGFGGPVFQSGGFEWTATAADGTLYLEPSPQPLEDQALAETRVLRWTPGKTFADTIVLDTIPLVTDVDADLVVPGSPRPVLAPGSDGRLAIGGEDGHYRIRMIGPAGAIERTVCRDVPSIPLTQQEIGAEATPDLPAGPETERRLAAIRAAPRPDPPAPFGRMFYSTDGQLWVQRNRPSPGNAHDRYFGVPGANWDVFAPDGEWLGQTVAPPAARIMAATGETVYALEESADGAIWLVALRLDFEPN
jgi:hypothetical protein